MRGISGCFFNVFQLVHAFEISSAAFLYLAIVVFGKLDWGWNKRVGPCESLS